MHERRFQRRNSNFRRPFVSFSVQEKGESQGELKVPLSASVLGKEAKFSSRTTEFQNPYEINNIGITILQMRNLGRRQ